MAKKDTTAVMIPPQTSLLLDVQLFGHAHDVAKLLAASDIVPKLFRDNICNCVIALNLAHRLQIDPFMLMQKMYVISGKPGIEAQLKVALFQQNSARYGNIQYKMEGADEGVDQLKCTAYAIDKLTNETVYGPTVSIEIAKKEGWYDKSGSKWKTIPVKMLMYRAASWFIDVYEPGALLGLPTADELADSVDFSALPNVSGANSEVIDLPPSKKLPPPEKTTAPDTERKDAKAPPEEIPADVPSEELAKLKEELISDSKDWTNA